LTYKMVHERILPRIRAHFEEQTPMIEGELNRELFGVKSIAPVSTTTVLQVDAPGKRVQLWTGQSVGVGEGAQFAVYPQGTADLTDPGGRKAVVEVSEDQAVQSWARLVWPDKM